MKYEFWTEYEFAARCFALRTSFDSWSRLIRSLGSLIAPYASGGNGIAWLDIGSGDGWTINELLQSINDINRHGVEYFVSWSLIGELGVFNGMYCLQGPAVESYLRPTLISMT